MKKLLSLVLAVMIIIPMFSAFVLTTIAEDHTENPRLLGDVDSDMEVTIIDVTYIQRELALIPIPFELDNTIADTDEDGVVSIIDATFIGKWLVGLRSNDNIGLPVNTAQTPTPLSWHQCPQPVRDYLDYVEAHPYDPNDHSYTYINDFASIPADQSNSKPVGITIDGVTFRDNEPNKVVQFRTDNEAGTLIALDRVMWYNTTCRSRSAGEYYDCGYNCRDLGGWACDGGAVKYGMLVRSGELNPDDKKLMVDKIGIRTEVSLLPTSKQATRSSPWGIDWVSNPTDVDFMYRIDNGVKGQWKLYLKTIFESVAQNKPVIFHCGAGADKAGTMSVMLMGILGCSQQDIDIDYELTAFSISADWRNRTYIEYNNYLNAIKSTPLAKGLSDSFQNRCISFALSLGITMKEINAFRQNAINGTPAVL